ncbi:MAG: hypothetical protein Q9O62_07330 [Ardenticatenia bacterium]|nr:hypothetical protein [Ardenticatenia bacterium]
MNTPAGRVARRRAALGGALVLYGAAIAVWSGLFHSSDGLAVYTVADSLVRYGRLDVEQIRWMGLQQATPGPDGLLYSRKGFGTTAAILPLVAAAFSLPGVGPVHAALLYGPLLLALSGLLLVLAIVRAWPRLSPHKVFLLVIIWGLGSPAWAYTKTLFSEPLVALATIGALERLVAVEQAQDEQARGQALLGVGGWLALGILARAAHIVVVLPFGVAVGLILVRRAGFGGEGPLTWSELVRSGARLGLPVVLSGLAVFWYNWARFGHPLITGYLESEAFTGIWWQGILGQLLSPGRGLIWYAPWTVLLLGRARAAWHRWPATTVAAIGSAVVYVLLYGKWYMWHGGFAWGPRFLVPTLPLLAWLVAPATARRDRMLLALGAMGVAVNLVGVAWDFDIQQAALLQSGLPLFDPRTFFDPRYAQIPGLLRLGRWENLDVMWVQEGRLLWQPALLAWGSALVGSTVGLRLAVRPHVLRALRPTPLAGLLVMFTFLLLLQARRQAPPAYLAVARRLDKGPTQVMVWHDDPPGTEYLLNVYTGRAAILGANETDVSPSPTVANRLATLGDRPVPVWVISDGPDRQHNALDVFAGRTRGLVFEEQLDDLRLAFYFDTPAWVEQPLGVTIGPEGRPVIRLQRVGLVPHAAPGEIVAVRLVWEPLQPVREDYQVFFHVIGPDARRVAQHDSPPQNGLAPTSTWQPRRAYTDTHAVRLPQDVAPGRYTLLVGMYRLDDLSRLRAADGQDAFVVGTVKVEREEKHE